MTKGSVIKEPRKRSKRFFFSSSLYFFLISMNHKFSLAIDFDYTERRVMIFLHSLMKNYYYSITIHLSRTVIDKTYWDLINQINCQSRHPSTDLSDKSISCRRLLNLCRKLIICLHFFSNFDELFINLCHLLDIFF